MKYTHVLFQSLHTEMGHENNKNNVGTKHLSLR